MADRKITIEDVNRIVFPDYFQSRQWDILRLRLSGHTYTQMSKVLRISKSNARDRMNEVRHILHLPFRKRGDKELMAWAIRNDLITINFEMPEEKNRPVDTPPERKL